MAYTATLRKLAENLKATYDNTIFSHSGNIGDTREKEVIDYLTRVMAHKYGFQSGEIFDKDDLNSGQVDVIIYDNLFSTVFTDGTGKVFAPVESTYGIVSVKSKMGTRELSHAIQGIKKYEILKRPSLPENKIQIMPDFAISIGSGFSIKGASFFQKNINCIFAFDTTIRVDTIVQKLKLSQCVDLLIVPGKFCVIGRRRQEFGLSGADGNPLEYVSINNENSVSLFILLLQTYLSRNRLIARDIQNLIMDIVHDSMLTMAL